MGYTTIISPCGCRHIQIMERKNDFLIEWIKCKEHYNPDIDDKIIVLAAKNMREHRDHVMEGK